MADGKGCTCCAYGSYEYGCDADWTPQEVYDLRNALRESRGEIERLREVLEFYAKGKTPYYLQFDLGLKARQALATSCSIRDEKDE